MNGDPGGLLDELNMCQYNCVPVSVYSICEKHYLGAIVLTCDLSKNLSFRWGDMTWPKKDSNKVKDIQFWRWKFYVVNHRKLELEEGLRLKVLGNNFFQIYFQPLFAVEEKIGTDQDWHRPRHKNQHHHNIWHNLIDPLWHDTVQKRCQNKFETRQRK